MTLELLAELALVKEQNTQLWNAIEKIRCDVAVNNEFDLSTKTAIFEIINKHIDEVDTSDHS